MITWHMMTHYVDDADMDSFLPLNLVTSVSDPKNMIIYELPRCDSEMHKKSFVPRCLFAFRINAAQ